MKRKSYKSIFSVGAVLTGLLLFTQFRDGEEKKVFRALVSPERAQAIAFNDLKATPDGVELSHLNHFVQFGTQGVLFQPKRGPEWKWQLEHLGTSEESLKDISIQSVKPENKTSQIVEYRYGSVIEEYHAKANTVEQRFVLEKPLALEGQDLVIRGSVECEGEFEQLKEGWAWKDSQGQVALGDVTVFDAQGKVLMASMNVTAHQTEIVVDAQSLAQAKYPVTVDPEIGANDFRISDIDPNGDTTLVAIQSEIAYNSTNNEYLVVWSNAVNNTGIGMGFPFGFDREIFGQRIDAATGAEIGANDFRISDMGAPSGMLMQPVSFIAFCPDVTYNPHNNEYLVVWSGIKGPSPLLEGEFEIYGQRLDASTGLFKGVKDFRISDMGPDGDVDFDALNPMVAHNSIDNNYLVVWEADDGFFLGTLGNDEFEIYGQLIDGSTGAELGSNDFRISDMGPDILPQFSASKPAVAHNSVNNEFLVVWEGDDNTFPLVEGEKEIFGQRIDGSTGVEIGANDFRISDMGVDGDDIFNAVSPAIAYNSTNNEYLVIWVGGDTPATFAGSPSAEMEVFGQRISGTGFEVGINDFRISDMGPDGDGTFFVEFFSSNAKLAVSYNSKDNEYLVVWSGGDTLNTTIGGVPAGSSLSVEIEVFAQQINASNGQEVGINDFRVSDAGPDGESSFTARRPAVAFGSIENEYLIVWEGNDDIPPLVQADHEIFGQLFKTEDSLVSDVDKLSLMDGGVQNLILDFGPNFAGQNYLVLGSLIGTSPGTPLGGKTLPLNIGPYFLSTLNNPNNGTLPNGFGVLDANGRATVQFVLPPGLNLPSGTIVNHAAAVIDAQPNLLKVSAVSNAEPCTLE